MTTHPTSKFEFAQKAERSFRRAVRKLYEERARNNDTVSIWRDDKVLIVPARELLKEMDRNGDHPRTTIPPVPNSRNDAV